MQSKLFPTLTISLGLLIGSFLSIATAEDTLQAQAATPAPVATTTSPKTTATLEKTPEKGGYTLAISSNIPGYEKPPPLNLIQ